MASNSRRGAALLLLVGALLTGATATAQAAAPQGGTAHQSGKAHHGTPAHHAPTTRSIGYQCPSLIVIRDTSWGDQYCPPPVFQ